MQIYKLGMAWVGRVLEISPIPDADRIERCEVVCGKGGKWSGVIRKGDISKDDKVVVFLPDSIVPNLPILSFMEQRGWRVKMMRLRGCPSEVLIIPFSSLLPGVILDVGDDVTDLLDVMKYEKEIPLSLAGEMVGAFPSFIPKTDEPNFQTVPEMRSALVGYGCTMTVKYNGTSQTFYHRSGHIGCCSRNWELRDKGKTAVWNIAHRYDLPEELAKIGNFALQWECVGPKIQGNSLKLSRIEPRVFDVFDIDAQRYLDYEDAADVSIALGLPFVETHFITFRDFSDDELREMAEGKYGESGRQREGIVIRPLEEMKVDSERVSFKVINLRYKE